MFAPVEARKKNQPPSNAVRLFSFAIHSLITLGALFTVTALYAAKTPAQSVATSDDVVRVNTDLLLFPVRIRDKRGQAVTGLRQRDLVLRDEDSVTTAVYFSAGADRVALVFALDQSGSLRETISRQRDAALALLGRFGERSSIAVLRFADTPSLVVPPTRDTTAARKAFDFSAEANRHTAIFDAAASALMAFDSLPRVRAERHIVILISDGLDNASKVRPGAVIEAALDKRVSFYVIHLPLFEPRNGILAVRPPAKGFRELADKTGGKYFLVGDADSAVAPNKKNDLAPVFQAIEEDLKSQYLLGFYLNETARDGRKQVFSVGLVPAGVEYSVGRLGYSRTHKFFVKTSPGAARIPN